MRMNTGWVAAVLLAALSLGGCGGMLRSSEEVLAAPVGSTVFQSSEDWRETTRFVDDVFRRCWVRKYGEFNDTVSEVRIDGANERALIELTLHGALGPQNYLTADVRPAATGSTVTLYHGTKFSWRYAEITKAQVVDGHRKCNVPKKQKV